MGGHSCYSTILFDFDGTLTSSLPLWVKAFQFALEHYGIQLSEEAVVSRCFYRDWEHIMAEFHLPSLEEFSTLMYAGLEEAFLQAKPFAGALEFLRDCCRQDITLGLVTSSRKSIVMRFLASYGITDYFGTIVTQEDVDNHKPHPEPIILALSQLEKAATGAILIGDSNADMQAAGNAGIHKGLFIPEEHRIYYDFEELKSHAPDVVFQDYSELPGKLLLQASHSSSGSPTHQV